MGLSRCQLECTKDATLYQDTNTVMVEGLVDTIARAGVFRTDSPGFKARFRFERRLPVKPAVC